DRRHRAAAAQPRLHRARSGVRRTQARCRSGCELAMCGIAGFTTPAVRSPSERESRYGTRLRAMTASLRHRGPDAQNAVLRDGVALGHTRLAIIDPEGGAQPMSDASGRVTIVFNGEVFNYLELRAALEPGYHFTTA